MKILILGGTRFVGRHIVHSAIAADDDVTLFNRGRTQQEPPRGTRLITGDRHADVSALTRDTWDCVIDVSGYFPYDVRRTAEALAGRVSHYVYISTVSVYPPTAPPNADETTAMLEVPTDIADDAAFAYGGQKANCERVLTDVLSDQLLTIVRPTIVIGPHDTTDRFTWWVRRIADGGSIPVPANLAQPLQLIDGRDLAAFTLSVSHSRTPGTFNAAGPRQRATVGDVIDRIAAVTENQAAERIPVTAAGLAAAGVALPLTLPEGNSTTMFEVSIDRALAAGLTLRSLDDSIRDTLAWDRERGLPQLITGPDAEAEARLLAASR